MEEKDPGGMSATIIRWLRRTYAVPVMVLTLLRLDDAGFFLWGAINKAPWNSWGCGSPTWYAPGFCVRGILNAEATGIPYGLGSGIQNYVLPHYEAFGWFQFSVETFLAVFLFLGLFTRGVALLAFLWSLVVSGGYIWIPGEVFPDSMLFILAPLILLTASGSAFLTLDRYLRPRLLSSSNRGIRWLARWTYG